MLDSLDIIMAAQNVFLQKASMRNVLVTDTGQDVPLRQLWSVCDSIWVLMLF